MAFDVAVFYRDEDEKQHFIGAVVVPGPKASQARSQALDKLWDPRLDCASCVPVTQILSSNVKLESNNSYVK